MLAGAYAMEAYVPAGAPRVVATWGSAGDGRATDRVEVVGIRPDLLQPLRAKAPSDTVWTMALRVIVDDASGGAPTPAVTGRYSALADRIRFEPRFPFAPGVAYRVEVDTGRLSTLSGISRDQAGRTLLIHRFSLPAPRIERTTRVAAVHPAADRVPSNMLRWYIELSAPMEPGSAHEHVRLIDEAGREVERAFLQLDEELWDTERRRLTLLFDPGRVKRGVRANLEMGAPLVERRRYRLVIDPGWLDARGAALASGFDKEFDVGPADRESPHPSRWTIDAPRAGTTTPLQVAFGEALDHALVARMLTVERDGRTVDGTATVGPGDSIWAFTPAASWVAGVHTLRVSATLEDLAGNSIARVFDADRPPAAPGPEGAARVGAWRRVTFRVQ